MTLAKAIEIVRRKWGEAGECRSCGWHGGLYEYDLEEEVYINETKKRIESGHRGVYIYY